MPLTNRTQQRLVTAGVVLSLAAWGVHVAVPEAGDVLAATAANLARPAQEWLTLDGDDASLVHERDQARRALAKRGDDRSLRAELDTLLGSATTAGREVTPARVVAFTPPNTAGSKQQVTIDVGSRDGVREQQTVVAAPGLVGRTVQVRERSADVELLTSPGAVVGARVKRSAALASLAASPPPGVPRREPGELTLSFVEGGDVRAGDVVRTLGSVGDRPYVRDVVVGRIVAVDPDRGQLGRTARVKPFVDVASLDVVGVVRAVERDQPRPRASGTGSR